MKGVAIIDSSGELLASADSVEGALRGVIGRNMLAARRAAKLSQAQLARRVGRSQTFVGRVERGVIACGEAYVLAVLQACGLPADWRP